MSKKRLITLILSIGIFLSLAATVLLLANLGGIKKTALSKGRFLKVFIRLMPKLMLR